jgi:hypothetical protein
VQMQVGRTDLVKRLEFMYHVGGEQGHSQRCIVQAQVGRGEGWTTPRVANTRCQGSPQTLKEARKSAAATYVECGFVTPPWV